jgi:hypothetical protein
VGKGEWPAVAGPRWDETGDIPDWLSPKQMTWKCCLAAELSALSASSAFSASYASSASPAPPSSRDSLQSRLLASSTRRRQSLPHPPSPIPHPSSPVEERVPSPTSRSRGTPRHPTASHDTLARDDSNREIEIGERATMTSSTRRRKSGTRASIACVLTL